MAMVFGNPMMAQQPQQQPLYGQMPRMNPLVQALLAERPLPGTGSSPVPDLTAAARFMNQPDTGEPDPVFGYGIGNMFSKLGIGSTYQNSAATGALGNNNLGGYGFASPY